MSVPESRQDERQLGRTEPQVQRIDDSGAEETRVVQLEVLVPVPGNDRVPVAASHAELGLHRGCQAQRPLEMHAERPVVGAVVEADPVRGAVRGGEQQPPVDEFLHACTVGTLGRSARLDPRIVLIGLRPSAVSQCFCVRPEV